MVPWYWTLIGSRGVFQCLEYQVIFPIRNDINRNNWFACIPNLPILFPIGEVTVEL